jgi:serine/threonine protein kinase
MLPEGQQLSHYRLARLLKSGGMGEVYIAEDTLLQRQVAIKVIQIDFNRYAETDATKEAARLFLREAQAIAQLDQINILPLYDSGEEHVNGATLMYMVMPYRRDGSLKDWLRTHCGQELLPLQAVERIVRQAAFALQHAHDHQIIHQDVKPANFLVYSETEDPGRLNLQLADFGVAKFMMRTSQSQIIRGTPMYMAPEQWEGHPVPATDQYALAVMAYYCYDYRLSPLSSGC